MPSALWPGFVWNGYEWVSPERYEEQRQSYLPLLPPLQPVPPGAPIYFEDMPGEKL